MPHDRKREEVGIAVVVICDKSPHWTESELSASEQRGLGKGQPRRRRCSRPENLPDPMRIPEMARPMPTNCWICSVPSKMSWVLLSCPASIAK